METDQVLKDKEEGELEEGEITSGDEDEQKVVATEDYELIQRPTSWIQNLKKVKDDGNVREQGSSRTMGASAILLNNSSYQPLQRPERPEPYNAVNAYDGADEDYMSDGSESSSDDVDSDEDGPMGKKSRRMGESSSSFPNAHISQAWSHKKISSRPLGESSSTAASLEAFQAQAVSFQQKRKPNNIWSKVLQDEEVSDIFGKVHVEERDGPLDVHIDRGPESFSIKLTNLPRPTVYRSDSSSVSSGGLTDNELEYLRGGPEAEQREPMPMDLPLKDDTGEEFCEEFGRGRPRKRRFFTKERRKRKDQKKRMVRQMRRKKAHDLAGYMAEKLAEPKKNLLVNSITLLGKEACIKLFLKTMKIERRGGLLIKNQQRRRTPGGVFFYLLRGDQKFPQNLVNKVFETEKQHQTKSRKRDYKKKRLARKAKLEMTKTLNEGKQDEDDDEEKEDCDEDIAYQVNQDGMEEDSDGSLAGGENESELDSDEFYGIGEDPTATALTAGPPREVVNYDVDDYIDIHCDPTDIA